MKTKLSEISTVTMGQSPKSSAYNFDRNGLPLLQGKTTFGRMYPYFEVWTSEWNKEADKDDLLFTVRAPVGDINIASESIAIGRGIAAIKAIKCSYKYLYYLLIANKEKFVLSSTGTIYDSINKNDLESVELNIHGACEQQHIVDTIDSFLIFQLPFLLIPYSYQIVLIIQRRFSLFHCLFLLHSFY